MPARHACHRALYATDSLLCNTADAIDLLGVALDGNTPHANISAGRGEGQFESALSVLVKAKELGITTKVNTVVTQRNCGTIGHLAKLIRDVGASIWSIYEFWPLGPNALRNQRVLELPPNDFCELVRKLTTQNTDLPIEIGRRTDRSSYFFVSQTGRAYTVSNTENHKYIELGTIFSACVLNRWARVVTPSENGIRSEKRRHIIG